MHLVPSFSQVRTKAQRLSEWENMTDKQKTAVTELEKLKKALTTQVSNATTPRRTDHDEKVI